MKVVVIGATGNVGTSVVEALAGDEAVSEIVGLARRIPAAPPTPPKLRWASADVTADPLVPHLEGAGAVVHLAWAIQPSRDRELTRRINVEGSRRVFEAAIAAAVPAIVYASSVGAYSAAPPEQPPVDESWPTDGVPTSFYSVDKAAVERILDDVESANPDRRVVRLRPALIFKREAGSEIRRLFAGPLLPSPLLRPRWIPALPWVEGLRTQVVHSRDVGEAYRLAVSGEARGPFNLAAEPILTRERAAAALDARPLPPLPPRPLRRLVAASWRARLQPTPPGWLDMGLGAPLMDVSRAREELGWTPRHESTDTLRELLEGIAAGAGAPTPALAPDSERGLRPRFAELAHGSPR
jgi:UDP-glucose 4-epimerase